MKNEGKMTFREGLSLNFRAFKILRQKMPWLFESIFCNAVLTAIIPYIGIYFSARILNELGGQRRPEVLWKWVLLTVVVTALAGLLKAVAARWQYSRENLSYFARTDIYNDKMLRMDFCVLDEQHTHDLYSQIKQNDNWHCWGLWTMRLDFERIINAIITILSGLALSVSLFTLPVPEGSRYAFLNSPLFILAFLAIMAAVIFLAPLCSTKADGYWVKASEGAKFGNRIFGFFWYSMHTKERMLDMRMYNQQDICFSLFRRLYEMSESRTVHKRSASAVTGTPHCFKFHLFSIITKPSELFFQRAMGIFRCINGTIGPCLFYLLHFIPPRLSSPLS